ncbi:MAG: DUF998 domain-containing protein [Thermoplasmata archaeon]
MDRSRSIFLLGLIGPLLTLTLIFIDIAISPWYSWSKNALSDLGVHPYSYLFNGGVIIGGLSEMIFFVYVGRDVKYFKGIYAVLALGGASLALVGVFNENSPDDLHLIFALLYFVLFPISAIIVGARTAGKNHGFSAYSILSGIIALAVILYGIMFIFRVVSPIVGLGVPETIEAVILASWSAVISIAIVEKKGLFELDLKPSSMDS